MPPTLRERRRRETRHEISDAALELFEERGYAGTTVDDIAARAGVSQRTFFRYFPTKEDTVLTGVEDLSTALAAALTDGMPEDLVLEHVEAAHLRLLDDLISGDPDAVLRILRVRRLVMNDPDLRGAAALMDFENVRKLTEQIAATLSPDADPVLPRLIVETSSATLRVAFDIWVEHAEAGEVADLAVIYRDCRAKLHGILGAPPSERER
ncbi:TetR family transcriptional regulator [Rhodococcus sp. NPDC003348]